MPALGDSDGNSFHKAADNIIFQLDDAKMMAITCPKDGGGSAGKPDETGCSESISDGGESDANVDDAGSPNQKRSDTDEQFECLPKPKSLWGRDEILGAAKAWAAARARFLPVQIERWHLATLADTVLSKFPGQSDMATSFIDSQPETLFAPDARKLRIVTHM